MGGKSGRNYLKWPFHATDSLAFRTYVTFMPSPYPPHPPRTPSPEWLPGRQYQAFAAAGTDAHRLCTIGTGWVERFGDDVLISHKDDASLTILREGLESWAEANGFHPRRVFGKFLPKQNEERIAPTLIQGDTTLPLLTTVTENGVHYGLDFGAGYSAGLFIDQRANRAFVHRAAPRRLLNTFAYTCSFSVVAALARRCGNGQRRSFEEIAGPWTGKLCPQRPGRRRPPLLCGRRAGCAAAPGPQKRTIRHHRPRSAHLFARQQGTPVPGRGGHGIPAHRSAGTRRAPRGGFCFPPIARGSTAARWNRLPALP